MERVKSSQPNAQMRHEAELAEAILEMLAGQSRPVTLERIAAWRLAQHQEQFDAESVARAVWRLTAQGVLEEVGDGRLRLYRLKRGVEARGAPRKFAPRE
jgi:hypothetical protein